MKVSYNDILSFWFIEINPSKWWIKDLDFDQLITVKFEELLEQANKCELFDWRNSVQGRAKGGYDRRNEKR